MKRWGGKVRAEIIPPANFPARVKYENPEGNSLKKARRRGMFFSVIMSKADNRKRVLVPQAKPGEVYAVEEKANGSFTLTVVRPSAPLRPKCRLAKEGGFTVAVPGQPINEQAIKELLADFP